MGEFEAISMDDGGAIWLPWGCWMDRDGTRQLRGDCGGCEWLKKWLDRAAGVAVVEPQHGRGREMHW